MKRIAVVGAGGFVGTTLVERLASHGHDVKPFINSGRNAWRLARLGIDLTCVDVLDAAALERAVSGCTHVVNCVMGDDRVMIDGLRNLLTACERAHVERFVQLSSITVYGEPPPPESTDEDAVPRPRRGTYGWIKMRQDDMVARAADRGLSCAILCPPIVSGPYSTQLLCLVDAIAHGRFAIVDGGDGPCSLVDVQNLAQAIELALESVRVETRRLFIVDEHCATWRELIDSLTPVIDRWLPLPRVTADEARRQIDATGRVRLSPGRTLRHLVSPEVRAALRGDPLYAAFEGWMSRTARRILPAQRLAAMRKRRRDAQSNRREAPPRGYDPLFLARQLRGVRHSGARARRDLGFAPEISFRTGMNRFCSWYSAIHGWTDPNSDLVRHLEIT
jgi:nucleoside-diphosphate-sugar epimerase